MKTPLQKLIKKYDIQISEEDLEKLIKEEMFQFADAWTDGFNTGMAEIAIKTLNFHNWRAFYEEKYNNGK
jgi:hypothetical protein